MFRIITLVLFCSAFSSLTIADEGEHEHHGHHGGRNYGAVERDYYYEKSSSIRSTATTALQQL